MCERIFAYVIINRNNIKYWWKWLVAIVYVVRFGRKWRAACHLSPREINRQREITSKYLLILLLCIILWLLQVRFMGWACVCRVCWHSVFGVCVCVCLKPSYYCCYNSYMRFMACGNTASHLPGLTPALWPPLIGHKFILSKYIKLEMNIHIPCIPSLAHRCHFHSFGNFLSSSICRVIIKLGSTWYTRASCSLHRCVWCVLRARTSELRAFDMQHRKTERQQIDRKLCERSVKIKRSDEVVHHHRTSATS